MNDEYVFIQGAKIRYWDSGGEGPAVLMTHGIGQSLEFWHRQFETLGPQMRLIAWDMPGHGLSDELEAAIDLDGQARVAWSLLDNLGVDKATLVGNSLGAAMSLRMLKQAASRVSGLLLANSAALGKEVFVAFRIMSLPVLGEIMNKPGPTAVKQQIKAIVRDPAAITPTVQKAIQRNVHRPGGVTHFLKLLRLLTQFKGQGDEGVQESHDILRTAQVPTLIVHGEQDAVIPVRHSHSAKVSMPSAELLVFDNCGHTPQLEVTKAFNHQLQSLLSRVKDSQKHPVSPFAHNEETQST